MHSILFTIAYDGGPFSGWALQSNARTVAGEVLGALRAIDPSIQTVRGASRTDAGVHARCQLAAFDPSLTIAPKGWALAVAAHLPREIAVRVAARVELGADPRTSAIRKRYRYVVLLDEVRDPFWEGRAMRWIGRFDLALARAEASALVGTHDFAAFRSSADERTNTTRTIFDVRVGRLADDARCIAIEVVGSGFLHNMVRIVAGTLVDVARGRLGRGAVENGLRSLDRRVLGMTAPACGLYLEHIEHSIAVEDAWPPAAVP